jgi:hypothetical protein
MDCGFPTGFRAMLATWDIGIRHLAGQCPTEKWNSRRMPRRPSDCGRSAPGIRGALNPGIQTAAGTRAPWARIGDPHRSRKV